LKRKLTGEQQVERWVLYDSDKFLDINKYLVSCKLDTVFATILDTTFCTEIIPVFTIVQRLLLGIIAHEI
jgi:hypothetical protein